ncbi:HNH endonuclease signature motif containing protein [Pectobacterium carotovorum]|uniref:HNH endonuclease signature motif containing protein n=1 Tax=Pectobacterium carotovorum TaxID=554 RepID=UPI0021F31884|nr:HNH endonuclease signature motif containing protein [Pectobacterium carotovorum]
MSDITNEFVKEILSYDPETGIFIWKDRDERYFSDKRACSTWNRKYPGTVAGTPDNKGYLRISINNKKHKSHRIAWLYVYGYWPELIDHINGNKSDNRIKNLRDVSFSENMRNRPTLKSSSTGVNGVVKSSNGKGFLAHINVDGVNKYLGTFPSIDEAVRERKIADSIYGYHENHGRN